MLLGSPAREMAEMGMKPEGKSGAKSSFAVTCSRLSQYIKEKGSIADLGLGMAPRPQETAKGKAEAFRPPTMMSFLPGADVLGDGEGGTAGGGGGDDDDVSCGNAMDLFPRRSGFGDEARKASDAREPEKAQLTIFYGGKVLVFDNFPAEKAKDLMQIAGKGSSKAQNFGFAPRSFKATAALDHPHGPVPVPGPADPSLAAQAHVQNRARPHVSDLPIARRASLHRFLEKRKDRINSKAPYQVNGSSEMVASVKQEESQHWLGLGPQIPKPSLSLVNSNCSR